MNRIKGSILAWSVPWITKIQNIIIDHRERLMPYLEEIKMAATINTKQNTANKNEIAYSPEHQLCRW